MDHEAKYKPREEWPDFVTDSLERVGIGRYETVETITPKIEALGLQIVEMREDWTSMIATRPLYYAVVIDPSDHLSVHGQGWSETDYAESLAWATAWVLNDRDDRRLRRERHLASTDPIDDVLSSYGLTVRAAMLNMKTLPEDAPTEEFVAHVSVGDEVVARVETPLCRGGIQWNQRKELRLQLQLLKWARECDIKERLGLVRLIIDPGTPQQRAYPVNRGEVTS